MVQSLRDRIKSQEELLKEERDTTLRGNEIFHQNEIDRLKEHTAETMKTLNDLAPDISEL
jgi:hypothetical protein